MSDIYDKKKNTYFITGGGTGGHIYPAVAVCDALKKDSSTKKIFYVGNPDNLEFDIVKKKGYDFLPVKVSAMPRKLNLFTPFAFLKWGLELELANWKALVYIYKYKPDVVLGTGGYVSAPMIFAAKLAKIPYMIHDCDAKPGIVSRFVSDGAEMISLTFEEAKQFIKSKKCVVNGNPIREEFKTLSQHEARQNLGLKNKRTICVMGGSQGAKTINNALIGNLEVLSHKYDTQVIFQTGKKNYEKVIAQIEKVYPDYKNDKNIKVEPYFDNMFEVLKASDIAISRAGSLSLSEICAAGLASVLIPYPYAASDHQRKNARVMEQNGASFYLEDSETNPDTILQTLSAFLHDENKLKMMQEKALSLAKFDATENIVEQLKSIVRR